MNQNELLIEDTWTKGLGAGILCGGTEAQRIEAAKRLANERCTCSGEGDPEYTCPRCSAEEWLRELGIEESGR